jgi:hypothetical protein
MESLKEDLDVDKPLPSVITIKYAENHLYRIGLSLFSSGSQKRNRFHNPFFISILISLTILKSFTVILMKEDKYVLLIGDFAYFINGRYFLNVAIILFASLSLSSQILHYWKYHKNESPSYLKPFEMISGLVSPKSIGLTNREDIIELLNKSKLMFRISKLLTTEAVFVCFCVSFIPSSLNCSYFMIPIQLFWAIMFATYTNFAVNINFSQMTYFYIICLYLKLKLRNANNSIKNSSHKKQKMSNRKMKYFLKLLDSIILEINTYNNDLWSKYLMIVLMFDIIVIDLILFLSLFAKMSFFIKIIMFYASGIIFILLIILINTASSVSFEVKKSYKLLNKLFITNSKQVSIRMRIKV